MRGGWGISGNIAGFDQFFKNPVYLLHSVSETGESHHIK